MTNPWRTVPLMLVMAVVLTSGQLCDHQASVVEANSKFGIDLYQRIISGSVGSSMIFSPWSVSAALAMTYGGANGVTQVQMGQALRFYGMAAGCDPQDGFFSLMTLFQGASTINTANKIFIDTSFNLLPSFWSLTNTHYLAPAQVLNIHGNPAWSTDYINNWVADQTDGEITNLLSLLDSDTALVLVNAITFKDKWLKPFGKSSNGPFHVSNSNTVQSCKMEMSCGAALRKHGHVSGLDSQILELAYESNKVSMYIVRPNQIEGLAYLEYNLDLATLSSAIDDMTTKQVNVVLPKFSLSQNIDLKSHLQAMGMSDVFSQLSADLSGLGSGNLYVDFVQHMAIIRVDEEGTEASAATAVGVCYIRRRRTLPVEFDVDRPFLFFIRENTSGSILFMGRVTDPQSSCPPPIIDDIKSKDVVASVRG